MGELIFLGLLAAISVGAWAYTYDFAVSPLDKSGGAGLFPRLIILFIIGFIIIRFIQILLQKERKKFVFFDFFTGIRLFFLLSFVGYIAILERVGYLISSIVFLGLTVNVFYVKTTGGNGTLKSVLIRNISLIIFVILMQLFFHKILHIALPKGILSI